MHPTRSLTPDPDEFTLKVLKAIDDYPRAAYFVPRRPVMKSARKRRVRPLARRKTEKAKSYQKIASQLVRQKDLNRRLCAALQTISNDVTAIAVAITPVLLGLRSDGQISLPLQPMLFATIAFTIARTGIAALCAEYR